jgi:hypothetical protein
VFIVKFWWTAGKDAAKNEKELNRKLLNVRNKLLLIVEEIKDLLKDLPEGSSTRIYMSSAIGHLEWAIAAATRGNK